MAKWQQLSSKKDYKSALERIDVLIDAPRTDSVHNELVLLAYVVEEYEAKYSPIPDASPAEVIKFVMEMKGLKQKDLISILGSKSKVSKIMNGAAKIQPELIQPLSSFLAIPVSSLLPKVTYIENVSSKIVQVAEKGLIYKKKSKSQK